MQGPPPLRGPAQGGFVSAAPYVPPTPLRGPPPSRDPNHTPATTGNGFIHATPYSAPPLPPHPVSSSRTPASTSSGTAPAGFVNASAYVLPTPPPPGGGRRGEPAPPPSLHGPGTSAFVSVSTYSLPSPIEPGRPQPNVVQVATSSKTTFVSATPYTVPTPAGPPQDPARAPAIQRPTASTALNGPGLRGGDRPQPQPPSELPARPPVSESPSPSGVSHPPSLRPPPRPEGPSGGLCPMHAAHGNGSGGPRPALPAPHQNAVNGASAVHRPSATEVPQQPGASPAVGGPAVRPPVNQPGSALPSRPGLPTRPSTSATCPSADAHPPPQPLRPGGMTPPHHASAPIGVPALPHRPSAPSIAHPPAPGRPAMPPPVNHSHIGAPQGTAAQPGFIYPPPPPVVAASNMHPTAQNRDDIMEARLRLFPLILYGADLTSVYKGLPYVFFQQRPNSINVILDPQMGIRLCGEGDSRTIDLFFSRPAFCSNDKQFILRNGHDNRFFMLTLAPDTPDEVVEHLETILMCFATFYKKIFTEDELKEIALHEDKDLTSSKAARSIESGGTAVGKGMVTTAGWVGSGIRGMAGFIKDHTDAGHEEVTEEQRKRLESQAKTATKFRKGISAVSGAVAKGTTAAGVGIAKAGHWGVQQYKETDYYQEKQKGKEDEGPSTSDKAVNVAKAGGSAFGNVWSGLVISTKIVASDVRESTADVVEHRKGKEHAELTRTRFNMAADVTVGGFRTFDLVSMYYKLVPKLAIKVGAGALTYDPYKQDALHGIGWKEGWLKFEGDVREPWTLYYAVLKTYSFAWYRNECMEDLVGYIPCREIIAVKEISEQQTKYPHSLQIVAKGEQQLVSLWCEGQPGWVGGSNAEMLQRADEWIDTIMSVSFVQQKYRR